MKNILKFAGQFLRITIAFPLVFPVFLITTGIFALECALLGHGIYGEYKKNHPISEWLDRMWLVPWNNWIDSGSFR